MTKLAYLHEPGLLQNLKSRYDVNEIYVSHYSFLLIEANSFIGLELLICWFMASLLHDYSNCPFSCQGLSHAVVGSINAT